jgi:hypothetical protein
MSLLPYAPNAAEGGDPAPAAGACRKPRTEYYVDTGKGESPSRFRLRRASRAAASGILLRGANRARRRSWGKAMDGYRFTTDLFRIEPGEDEDINPRRYGRQLAQWLKAQLQSRGYPVEPVIDEDWGRCLMCAREPFELWVGCGNEVDYGTAQPGDPPPPAEQVVWWCVAMADVPWWKRWFTAVDAAPALTRLNAVLHEILSAEPRIRLLSDDEA